MLPPLDGKGRPRGGREGRIKKISFLMPTSLLGFFSDHFSPFVRELIGLCNRCHHLCKVTKLLGFGLGKHGCLTDAQFPERSVFKRNGERGASLLATLGEQLPDPAVCIGHPLIKDMDRRTDYGGFSFFCLCFHVR